MTLNREARREIEILDHEITKVAALNTEREKALTLKVDNAFKKLHEEQLAHQCTKMKLKQSE